MGETLVVSDVVDTDQLDVVGALRQDGPVEVAADAAEAVDAETDGHETRDSFTDRRLAPGWFWGAGAVAHVVVERRDPTLWHLSAGRDDGVHDRLVTGCTRRAVAGPTPAHGSSMSGVRLASVPGMPELGCPPVGHRQQPADPAGHGVLGHRRVDES